MIFDTTEKLITTYENQVDEHAKILAMLKQEHDNNLQSHKNTRVQPGSKEFRELGIKLRQEREQIQQEKQKLQYYKQKLSAATHFNDG